MTEETPWPRNDDTTRERFAPPAFWWALGVLVIIAAVAVYRYTREPEQPVRQSAPPPVVRPEAPSTPVETANAPKYPVPSVGEPSSLPELAQGNAFVQQALAKLIGGDAVANFLYPDDIVRRFVATVDNLPRKGSLSQARVVKPPAGSFQSAGTGDRASIDPANEHRYTAYVKLAESVDTNALVALYLRLYPLFEEQYRQLGYPGGHFNDRLIEAIDDLLAAPEAQSPVALVQPKIMYQFADADLEQLSAGQKAMIRLGIDNARRVKAKLRAIRAALVSKAQRSATP